MDIVERLRTGLPNVLKEREAANEIDSLRLQIAAKDVEIAKLNDALSETIAYYKRMMEANEAHLANVRTLPDNIQAHDAELIERCAKIVEMPPHWKTVVRNALREKAAAIRCLKDDV